MSLFGILSVWILVFGIVQSEFPTENGLVSDVDVKNLIQRLLLLEESLKVEKERNDELERTVNSLIKNLEQTKQTFEDKCSSLEKQLQEHRETQPRLSTHQNVSGKYQSGEKERRSKHSIDWWKPRYLTNHDSSEKPRVSKEMSSRNFQERLLVQPSPVTPTTVAFYAQISANIPESDATANHVMVFDIVNTNNGNGYHPSTGVFIVPESGIYVFSWSFRIGSPHLQSTQLMVNNNEAGVTHLRPGSGGNVSGSGLVLVHVNKGDDVYVKIKSAPGIGGTIYNDLYGRSYFAGWKLN